MTQVEADLAHATATVRAADPGLRSLVLTGAFARGEGAVLHGKAQNDYDLVALRGWRPSRVPYDELRRRLTRELGLHVDLAPVAAWRLPFVAHSIFWYETARKGKVLWGRDMLRRIPVQAAESIDRREGLRLLVNRSAGLLLATGMREPHAVRIQAAKALLAALDAQLLAAGVFPPSHRERWNALGQLRVDGRAPPNLAGDVGWFQWAYNYKVDPAHAEERSSDMAWRAARRAVLDAVPTALGHAGLRSLDDYAHKDGILDHLIYHRRSAHLPGARRWA
ncbi:MAG: hypothetical protein LC620_04845, partial [Halobacteriales archaeon]|nr:hypothetical protein [Halobacteriales archaeon]